MLLPLSHFHCYYSTGLSDFTIFYLDCDNFLIGPCFLSHSRSFPLLPPEWSFENIYLILLFLRWSVVHQDKPQTPSHATRTSMTCLSLRVIQAFLHTAHLPPPSQSFPDTMSQPFHALRVPLTSCCFFMLCSLLVSLSPGNVPLHFSCDHLHL